MPVFLKNGDINPAFLAAEREEIRKASQNNCAKLEKKRKKLVSSDSYTLASYLRKEIGEVGFQKSRDAGL